MAAAIDIRRDAIEVFCKKWDVKELALFGSVLREDFGADSDVDVLVTLSDNHTLDLFDWVAMGQELEAILGRPVDLVELSSLRNPHRRAAILTSKEEVYVA